MSLICIDFDSLFHILYCLVTEAKIFSLLIPFFDNFDILEGFFNLLHDIILNVKK